MVDPVAQPQSGGGNLLSGLNNLSVFDGVPDADRQRALLAAGLQLMQPQNPITGGGPLAGLSNGIQAGLTSLDASAARNTAADQQLFDNNIATRGAAVSEQQADAVTLNSESTAQNADSNTTNAESNAANATTNSAKVNQAIKEWNDGKDGREAKTALDNAKAKYWDRMPEAGGTLGNTSAADVTIAQHIAKMNQMLAADQALPITQQRFSGPDDPQLVDEAWGAITVREGLAGSEALGVISQNPADAADTGINILAATDPNAANARVEHTPAEIQQAEAMAGWTKAQWVAVRDNPAGNAEVEAILKKFPGVLNRARALLAE